MQASDGVCNAQTQNPNSYRRTWILSMVKSGFARGMAEWRNNGMAEWRNGGLAEWWNGGMVEWRSGGMAEWQTEWRNGRMADEMFAVIGTDYSLPASLTCQRLAKTSCSFGSFFCEP